MTRPRTRAGPPRHERFSRADAEALVGRRVRALAPYVYLPSGTTGSVVTAEEIEPDRFELVVEFDAPRRPRDWFTRVEFLEYLTET